MIIAQNTFTIKRIAKDEFNLVLSPETMAIPATSDGVADLTNAEFSVRVTKGGKELFPNFDESIGGRNLNLDSKYTVSSADGNYGKTFQYSSGLALNKLRGSKIALSCDYYSKDVVWGTAPGQYKRFYYELAVKYSDNTADYAAVVDYTTIPFEGRKSTIKQLKDLDVIQISFLRGAVQNLASGTIKATNFKLEFEDATDYTPAPEDILKYATITPYNCSAAIVGNKIKITSLTPGKDAGYVDVTVTYGEGFVDTKRFTWAKAKSGISVTLTDVEFAKNTNPATPPTTGWTTTAPTLSEGEQLWTRTKTAYSSGNPTYTTPANITPKTGTGIDSVTEEYAISASKTVQPTTGWSTTQPAWVNGQYIWSRVKVVYKNPTSTVYTGYAVSSEWEAVNNLEIGGRNLWAVSKSRRSYGYTGLYEFLSTVSVENYTYTVSGNISDTIAVKLLKQDIKGEYLHVQFMHSQNLPSLTFIVTYANASNQSLQNVTVTIPRNAKGIYSVLYKLIRQDFEFIYIQLMFIAQNSGLVYPYSFHNVGVYSSNKEIDWSPAPEDVQARIDLAKQEALTAAGNAQTSANSANTAVGNLNNYVEGAFKDGVIEASEAKAIEKYINIVNTEKVNLEATYNTLYVNTYLEGTAKTNLLNAKVTYFGAVDNLLNAINSAIANGKTTVAEKQDVDAKYNSYKSALASLQTAIESANKAIQTKLDSLSTERSDTLQTKIDAEKARINDILSDNIADPSEKQYLSNLWQEIYAEYPRIWTQAYNYGIDRSGYETAYTNLNNTLSPVLADLNTSTNVSGATIRARFSAYYDARIQIQNTITNKVNQNASDIGMVAADAQAKANEAAAKTQYQASIEGGLIYAAIMKLVDVITKTETAGLSGLPGDGSLPAFWAGGTYTQAIQGLAKAIIRHDGSVKFTDAVIEGVIKALYGQIGDVFIDQGGKLYVQDAQGVERLRIGNYNLTPLSVLMAASQTTKQQVFTGKSFYWDSGEGQHSETYTSPETLVLSASEAGSDITVTGDISANVYGRNVNSMITLLLKNTSEGYNYRVSFVQSDDYSPSNSESINAVFRSMPAGTYTFEVKFEASYLRLYGQPLEAFQTVGNATNLKMVSILRNDMKAIHLALDGLMAFYGKNKYLYINEKVTGDNPFLSIAGVTDIPGVLCAGRIASNANVQASWGAKKNRPGYQYAFVEKISTGRYRVHHSIGHTDYIPKLTGGVWLYSGNKRSGCPGFENVQAYSFDVFIMTDAGDPVDCAFAYECTGNNWV